MSPASPQHVAEVLLLEWRKGGHGRQDRGIGGRDFLIPTLVLGLRTFQDILSWHVQVSPQDGTCSFSGQTMVYTGRETAGGCELARCPEEPVASNKNCAPESSCPWLP